MVRTCPLLGRRPILKSLYSTFHGERLCLLHEPVVLRTHSSGYDGCRRNGGVGVEELRDSLEFSFHLQNEPENTSSV